MTVHSLLSVPEDVTFEQAIELGQSLLEQMERSEAEDTEIEAAVGQLVRTESGARGFFVTYLTDDRPFPDSPSPGVLRGLQSSPDTVAELLVKNLAMSSATAVAHRRRQDEKMAASSERVRSRSANLIQNLQLPAIRALAKKMRDSATTGEGAYQAFLDRWGYDAEQRQVIAEVLQPFAAG